MHSCSAECTHTNSWWCVRCEATYCRWKLHIFVPFSHYCIWSSMDEKWCLICHGWFVNLAGLSPCQTEKCLESLHPFKVSGVSPPVWKQLPTPVQTNLACFRKFAIFYASKDPFCTAPEINGSISRAIALHNIMCNSFYSEPASSPYCRFTIHPWVRSLFFVENSNQTFQLCQCGTIWSVLSVVVWVVMLLYITIRASS